MNRRIIGPNETNNLYQIDSSTTYEEVTPFEAKINSEFLFKCANNFKPSLPLTSAIVSNGGNSPIILVSIPLKYFANESA